MFFIEVMCDQKLKFKRIDFQRFIRVHKFVCDRICSFLDAGKFRIARESVLCLHGVGISVVTVGSALDFADKWEQHRSVAVPDCRIGTPDPFEILFFIVDTCKFGTVVGYRNLQIIIFNRMKHVDTS